MNHPTSIARQVSRRWFLRDCGVGLGSIAFTSLVGRNVLGNPQPKNPLAPRAPHFAPKAKRVIFLFQAGAPSHLDLFDHKPELEKWNGKPAPAELLKGYRAAFINPDSALMASRFKFAQHGPAGMTLSELLPHTAEVAGDLCFIKSMQTDAVNHAPAQILMNSGSQQFGRPSFGAWSLYGLGSESEELPGYVVLSSAKGTSGGAANWGCGFLPTMYAGVPFRAQGDPVLYLSNPRGIDAPMQRASLDTLRRLNELEFAESADPEIQTRINSYELAYRMQTSAPELMDIKGESKETLEMYGLDAAEPKAGFAKNCLLARRLVERGVRFVQLFHEAWDQHSGIKDLLPKNCKDTDQPAAALIKDLKQRGLLEDTLVIWGGEFGRTPMVQGAADDKAGRDHHNRCFTMWLAGGGIKGGTVFGETDELGFNVALNPVHVHDLHATLLHLLGLDHVRLTFRSQGRDFRLTDVHGKIVRAILV